MNLAPLLRSGGYTPDWRDLRWEDKVKKLNAPPKSLFVERKIVGMVAGEYVVYRQGRFCIFSNRLEARGCLNADGKDQVKKERSDKE